MQDIIDEMNTNLSTIFKKKEDELLNLYKNEMYQAQKALKELTETTSDDELRRRMNKKKEMLAKERQKFLETSLHFSNKCKQFKDTLNKVINSTKDLEGGN